MKLRGELRLIQRALNQGWPVPLAEQERCLQLIIDTMKSKTATSRETVAAIKTLEALLKHESATDSEIRKRANDALRRYRPSVC